MPHRVRVCGVLQRRNDWGLCYQSGSPFVIQAPLKRHPKGVPCAELASRRLTEGFLRKSETLCKRSQQYPSTSFAGPPPFSREALFTPKQKNGTPLPECRLPLLLFYSIFEKICVLKIICAYLTMYLPIDSTSFSGSSVCACSLIGLDRSRLKMPMIDFASMA